MKKYIIISLLSFQFIIPSEQPVVEVFRLEDIPWTTSKEASEVNNDSFCCSVISYFDPTDGEMLDEANMMGNEDAYQN